MAADKAAELDRVMKTSIQKMWLMDLELLEKAIVDLYDREKAELLGEATGAKKGKKRSGSAAKSRGRGKKADDEEQAGEGVDGEDDDAGADLLDNPFSDIARWTAGHLGKP